MILKSAETSWTMMQMRILSSHPNCPTHTCTSLTTEQDQQKVTVSHLSPTEADVEICSWLNTCPHRRPFPTLQPQ
ncbi:hypothetical protein RRG08_040733 [Elysia crispata]|uniref:Uncharacterized protein n=1 Tax=Elysia crispata TaxID=231223 RepID=A0AAE1EE56_9GAST|nr:hypothetical protein RRG08_040733 [Elysia crispata]